MRYGAEHKVESRERILNAAAARFRSGGTEAVRVIDVMRAAGMTSGGFYKHFTDKNQLLREAIKTALADMSGKIAKLTGGMPRQVALKTVIDFYLSEDHMLHPDLGCALAALGTEMARMAPAIKREVSKALDAYAERLGFLMPGQTRAEQQGAFLVLFPSMAGCLMTARAHASRKRQEQLLSGARLFFTQAFCNGTPGLYLEAMK